MNHDPKAARDRRERQHFACEKVPGLKDSATSSAWPRRVPSHPVDSKLLHNNAFVETENGFYTAELIYLVRGRRSNGRGCNSRLAPLVEPASFPRQTDHRGSKGDSGARSSRGAQVPITGRGRTGLQRRRRVPVPRSRPRPDHPGVGPGDERDQAPRCTRARIALAGVVATPGSDSPTHGRRLADPVHRRSNVEHHPGADAGSPWIGLDDTSAPSTRKPTSENPRRVTSRHAGADRRDSENRSFDHVHLDTAYHCAGTEADALKLFHRSE